MLFPFGGKACLQPPNANGVPALEQMANLLADTKDLKALLTKTKVSEPLQQFVVEKKGIESISDLYHFVKAATYDQEFHDMCRTPSLSE